VKEQPIVLGLIEQGDECLLQLRNGQTQVGALNLIGCFGGKVKAGETVEQAVVREIGEETSLATTPDDWQKLGEVAVDVPINGEMVHFPTTVFKTIVKPEIEIVAKEGELVRTDRELREINHSQLTPATAAVAKELL
jgi:8-oxo-dGTP pyrophosphatase MutT (NUDIX family)